MTQENAMKYSRRQDGFALILALLALMLLTSLGLSLSTTTSTELQIATNHRWSEQARYNAEAGIEAGRQLLATIPDWGAILPAPRPNVPAWTEGAQAPFPVPADALQNRTDAFGNPSRNFENSGCDAKGYGRGYGVVFDPPGAANPYQFTNNVAGFALNGAFTLWIRRPVVWVNNGANAGSLQDYGPGVGTCGVAPACNDVLILVAEGLAPFTGTGGARAGAASRATQIIEMVIGQGALGNNLLLLNSQCSNRQGQAGGSASGANSQGCAVLDGTSILPALTGAVNLGTGNLR